MAPPMQTPPEILIFVYRLNMRIRYIFGFIFKILQVPYRFTTTLEEFVAYNGPKFSYTRSRLANEFHIHASGLLDEKGVRPQQFDTGRWFDLPVIFYTPENASIPFDIFSAAFYLITRYEEYLPFGDDGHGRFPHTASVLWQLDRLERPLIDLWLERFKKTFTEVNPGFEFPSPTFRFRPLLSVNMSHLYKYKGILRQLGGIADNILHLDFKNLRNRLYYIFSRVRDPYDTFYKFIALKKQFSHELITFFPVSTYSAFDRNLPASRPVYRKIIQTMADYSDTGLLVSYYHENRPEQIKRERKRLEKIIHKPVKKSRMHYYRCRLPETYRALAADEFEEDYTCGYPSVPGFRAATAYPFVFYDLAEEELTGLLIQPVVISDYHLQYTLRYPPSQAWEKLTETGEKIRRTGGIFQPLFHNAVLSEFEEWKGWSEVYTKLLEKYAQGA